MLLRRENQAVGFLSPLDTLPPQGEALSKVDPSFKLLSYLVGELKCRDVPVEKGNHTRMVNCRMIWNRKTYCLSAWTFGWLEKKFWVQVCWWQMPYYHQLWIRNMWKCCINSDLTSTCHLTDQRLVNSLQISSNHSSLQKSMITHSVRPFWVDGAVASANRSPTCHVAAIIKDSLTSRLTARDRSMAAVVLLFRLQNATALAVCMATKCHVTGSRESVHGLAFVHVRFRAIEYHLSPQCRRQWTHIKAYETFLLLYSKPESFAFFPSF